MTGYSPYPKLANDTRLPHISDRLTAQIHKTALKAEEHVPYEHYDVPPLEALRQQGYHIAALEQAPNALVLSEYTLHSNIALLIGEERYGIPLDMLARCDTILEIPMYGQKESFNVSVATGIALYQLRVK